MTRLFAIRFNIIVFLLLNVYSANSQSDNYWSWNFNTSSVLMAGSVVAGSAGASAIFYNPSLIDHENMQSLSISASILSLQFFDAENIAGNGIDANKFIFKVQPRFLSYIMPTKNKRIGMEVAALSPVSENMDFNLQYFDDKDIIHRTDGFETYSGFLNYSKKYDDTWVGFGLSYELSDNFYVGASSFLSIKTMKYTYQQSAQAYQEGDSVQINLNTEAKYIAQSSFEEQMKYWNVSFLFKIGAQYKTKDERFSAGVNITLPNIRFMGQADVRKSYTRSNVFNNREDIFTSNQNFTRYEENVKSYVKSPFSIATGIQYFTKSKKNTITLTAEYFNSIDPYAVVYIPGNSDQIPDEIENSFQGDDLMSYYFQAKSVTNLGLGFKQYFSPKFFFLGGFRTDFSVGSVEDFRMVNDKFKVKEIHIDKHHLSFGPVLKIKNTNIVTGLQYTFGRNKNMEQIVNFSDPVEYNSISRQSLVGTQLNNANASVNELAFFLGVIVDL